MRPESEAGTTQNEVVVWSSMQTPPIYHCQESIVASTVAVALNAMPCTAVVGASRLMESGAVVTLIATLPVVDSQIAQRSTFAPLIGTSSCSTYFVPLPDSVSFQPWNA